MDAIDHGKVVLSTILHGRADLLEEVRSKVTDEYFVDPQQRTLLGLIERYWDDYHEVMPREAIADLLREEKPGAALQYQTYYDLVLTVEASEGKFRASLTQLVELGEERLVAEALTQGMEILRSGANKGGQRLRGPADARDHLLSVLADRKLDASSQGWEAPIPLTGTGPLPPFPVSSLPVWGAEMVGAVAESTQTPEDLAGIVYLGVLATAAGGRIKVQVTPEWREPVNLYAAPAMVPGSRKSAVFLEMTAPVLDAERELQAEAKPRHHRAHRSPADCPGGGTEGHQGGGGSYQNRRS